MPIHLKSAWTFLISVLMLAALVAPASGTPVCTTGNPCTGSTSSGQDTTDRTNFGTDNSDLTFNNITFNDATGTYDSSTSGLNSTTNPTAALLGVSFIGCITAGGGDCVSNSNGLMVDTNVNWGGGTNQFLRNATSGGGGISWDTITIGLPANVFAVGFDLIMAVTGSAAPFQVIVNGSSTLNTATAVALPGSVFFGYRSSTALSSISIYAQNSAVLLGMDNLELGSAAPVSDTPELATLLMVASGLIFLRFRRRWL